MNEAASFCVGSCGSGRLQLNPAHPYFEISTEPSYDYPEGFNVTNSTEAASASRSAAEATTQTASASTTSYYRTKPTPGVRNINHPPYAINHFRGDLAVHAVSPNATHHNGYQQYDTHNMYGHQLLQNTYAALKSTIPGSRPFIIGRSTFVGSGNYSGHWGGDNKSRFKDSKNQASTFLVSANSIKCTFLYLKRCLSRFLASRCSVLILAASVVRLTKSSATAGCKCN